MPLCTPTWLKGRDFLAITEETHRNLHRARRLQAPKLNFEENLKQSCLSGVEPSESTNSVARRTTYAVEKCC